MIDFAPVVPFIIANLIFCAEAGFQWAICLIRAVFLIHSSILNSALYVHMFLSWITEIFECMFSVGYVLQLSGVSLCLLSLYNFFSELLLCAVALARLKSRRAGCKYK